MFAVVPKEEQVMVLPIATGSGSHGREGGFTYLGLLFAVALVGVSLSAVGVLWATESQREKEQELIFIGEQFQRAIASYYERSPGLVKRYPPQLDDLLRDNRFLGVKRHLRRIYPDPMTGGIAWGLVRAPDGGVMGVYSTSAKKAINQRFRPDGEAGVGNDFVPGEHDLHGSSTYSDWRFVHRPVAINPGAQQ